MDKFEWNELTEAVIGLIDSWENKRKKNTKLRMVVQIEYSQIEINFLNVQNEEMLKTFKFDRNGVVEKSITTYNKAYNFIKNSHKMEV